MTIEIDCPANACEAFLERAESRCREHGAQLTPIRREVLALLLRSENGLKAYDLLAKVKEQRGNATPPTVYRALDFLIEQGLVHKIERLNQFVACRHESHQTPGLFLVCPCCGNVSELHDHALMAALVQRIGQAGRTLDGHEIEIASICPDCRPTEAEGTAPFTA